MVTLSEFSILAFVYTERRTALEYRRLDLLTWIMGNAATSDLHYCPIGGTT